MEEDDSEIWTSDGYCIACRSIFASEKEKLEHRASKRHVKKWNLHKFFRDESTIHGTMAVSEMLERYKLKKIPIIGLHQCQEIQQVGVSNQEKTNFWTCATCYEVGDTYELADAHLNSMDHIRNYMDECECDEKEQIEEECEDDEYAKYERYRSAAERIFARDGGIDGLQPPSILRMPLSTADGKAKFGIEDQVDVTFQQCPNDANRSVLHCSTCNEVAPVVVAGKYTKEKSRAHHCESTMHQQRAAVLSAINEFHPQEIFDEFKTGESQAQLHWTEKDDDGSWLLSQPCGYRYLINAGDERICTICYALVNGDDQVLEHFSSEYHAMKYLNMIHSYNSYLAQQLDGPERRAKALKMLISTLTLENDTKKVARTLSHFPSLIKSQLSEDVRVYPDPPLEVIDDFKETTGKMFRFCVSCCTYIEFDANLVDEPQKMAAAWKKHVFSAQHFETAAMRTRIDFNPMFFVPYSPTVTNAETDVKGVWKVNREVLVQTQCDVGLEFMVEDEAANEVTCQCCWQVFSKNPIFVNQHIRSYAHLKQYIFLTAPDIIRILLGAETDEKKQAFLMEWLQRHSGLFQKRIHLHSKLKTLELSSWAPVSRRLVQTSLLCRESSEKDVYESVLGLVDSVACDGEESIEMTAREALIAARMLIVNTSRRSDNTLASVVCRCENCELLVIVKAATWQDDVFKSHICTDEHHRRTAMCKENSLSAFGIIAEKSTYTVKPFVQKDATKKVIWQWNQTTKQHEYVSSIVGLDNIIERRYPGMELGIPKQQADFYCQLCAKVFPKRAIALESHVREMDHCIYWIQKYRQAQVRELFEHLANQTADKGKELRKFLSSILKEIHPPEDYCIKVYDPIGEEERKQFAILAKIQAEEKQRRLDEAKEKLAIDKEKLRLKKEALQRELEERNKAERQKKMDDEERHREKERQKKAERDARLQFAKENAAKLAAQEAKKDISLKSRLEQASMQQRERQKIDVQQAKLEAERILLLSKYPNFGKGPTAAAATRPQVTAKQVPLNPYGVSSFGVAQAIIVPDNNAQRFGVLQQQCVAKEPLKSWTPSKFRATLVRVFKTLRMRLELIMWLRFA
ncbi:C2H2-type domain-containing protein [Caenorhabditis elegans]|uniref:C2H2-type domain-containing protein n=1 Tax=Caenorhabditis elegans TaxID=6239 RepID=H8ESF6_CAEEL|nr:C2H2-type domain-containing protein [Caenorhabditis elegans]CCG28285.1 C2H2-type domain-containing protein [Caenorhabditis elegans]|eukprot:NP_001255159.1 Uncharacterized protein CELE_Y79H2A.3 [Caenorhabditis elegans]